MARALAISGEPGAGNGERPTGVGGQGPVDSKQLTGNGEQEAGSRKNFRYDKIPLWVKCFEKNTSLRLIFSLTELK